MHTQATVQIWPELRLKVVPSPEEEKAPQAPSASTRETVAAAPPTAVWSGDCDMEPSVPMLSMGTPAVAYTGHVMGPGVEGTGFVWRRTSVWGKPAC